MLAFGCQNITACRYDWYIILGARNEKVSLGEGVRVPNFSQLHSLGTAWFWSAAALPEQPEALLRAGSHPCREQRAKPLLTYWHTQLTWKKQLFLCRATSALVPELQQTAGSGVEREQENMAWSRSGGRLGTGHCSHEILKIWFISLTFSIGWVLLNQPEKKSYTVYGSKMAAHPWLEVCTSRRDAGPQECASEVGLLSAAVPESSLCWKPEQRSQWSLLN